MGVVPRVYEGECTHYQDHTILFPHQNAPIQSEEPFHLRLTWPDHQRRSFSPYNGRTLAFHQRHDGMVDQSKWVRVFEGEDAVKKGKGRKCFMSSDMKGISLSTNVINADTKGCNGSPIK